MYKEYIKHWHLGFAQMTWYQRSELSELCEIQLGFSRRFVILSNKRVHANVSGKPLLYLQGNVHSSKTLSSYSLNFSCIDHFNRFSHKRGSPLCTFPTAYSFLSLKIKLNLSKIGSNWTGLQNFSNISKIAMDYVKAWSCLLRLQDLLYCAENI